MPRTLEEEEEEEEEEGMLLPAGFFYFSYFSLRLERKKEGKHLTLIKASAREWNGLRL